MIDFGLDVFNKFLWLLRLIVVALVVVVVVVAVTVDVVIVIVVAVVVDVVVFVVTVVVVVALIVVVALVVVVVVVVINYNFCHISSSNFPFLGSHANKLIRKTEVMSVVGFLQVSSECHHMYYSIMYDSIIVLCIIVDFGEVVLVALGYKRN